MISINEVRQYHGNQDEAREVNDSNSCRVVGNALFLRQPGDNARLELNFQLEYSTVIANPCWSIVKWVARCLTKSFWKWNI